MRRRQFIRLAGGLLGSTLLAGCGGEAIPLTEPGPGGGPLPNQVVFTSLLARAAPLPGGGALEQFTGHVLLTAEEVFFEAQDDRGLKGIFAAAFSASSSGEGRLESLRSVVVQGESLADGTRVALIGPGDVSPAGDYACILTGQDGAQSPYLFPRAGAGRRVVGLGEALASNARIRFGSHFDHVALDEGGLLVSGYYGNEVSGAMTPRQGLFSFPGGRNGEGARLELGTRQLAPGSTGLLARLGLFDLAHGRYAIEVTLQGPQATARAVVLGQVGGEAVLGIAPAALSTPSSGAVAANPALAPRLDLSGSLAAVVLRPESGPEQLSLGGVEVPFASGLTPKGLSIERFLPPSFSQGFFYVMVRGRRPDRAERSWQLLVSDGEQHRHVLDLQDRTDPSGIDRLLAGVNPSQANPNGSLAAVGRRSGAPCLLLGTPI
ncbi:MAG: hypothetical protein AMXMBFR33_31080 [Candidatus Xenobia bacterium]